VVDYSTLVIINASGTAKTKITSVSNQFWRSTVNIDTLSQELYGRETPAEITLKNKPRRLTPFIISQHTHKLHR
jgi:hypothetical protein